MLKRHFLSLRRFSTARPARKPSGAVAAIAATAAFTGGIFAKVAYDYSQKPALPAFSSLDSSTTTLDQVTPIEYADDAQFAQALKEIKQVVGEHFSEETDVIKSVSDIFFSTHHPPKPEEQKPAIVVYPADTEEVSKILKIAYKYRVPVVANSGMTSLEGHTMHTRGPNSISVSLSRFTQIIELHPQDLDVVAQSAVGWQDLDEYLRSRDDAKHLSFGPDPGPGATLGGMASTSASGTNAYRYGTMKENIVNLTVVLADGTVIKTKQRPRKSAAGYDLTRLFIGSEGTLGLITEVTVKLNVRPVYEYVNVASFPTIKDACKTASKIIAESGLQLNALEILDHTMVSFVNEANVVEKKFAEKPTLFFKIGGPTKQAIAEQTSLVQSIAKENNLEVFDRSQSEEENELLWSARRHGLFSTLELGPKVLEDPNDVQIWTTDIAVPISKLPEVISVTSKDLDSSGFYGKYATMGHIGDGNCHFLILYNSKDYAKAQTVVDRLVKRAIDFEGTCTGEHGVGVGKRKYLPLELGETTVDLMRKIKFSMDPRAILNPDKVFKLESGDRLEDLLDSGHLQAAEKACCH